MEIIRAVGPMPQRRAVPEIQPNAHFNGARQVCLLSRCGSSRPGTRTARVWGFGFRVWGFGCGA